MPSSRVVLNRSRLNDIDRGLADGVLGIAAAIATRADARAPDATPFGVGLVQHGGAAVWVRGKKVAEMTTGATGAVAKPRDLRVTNQEHVIVGAVGFDFPARFNEIGTVHQPARPFVTPAAIEVVGSEAEIILSKEMARHLGTRP